MSQNYILSQISGLAPDSNQVEHVSTLDDECVGDRKLLARRSFLRRSASAAGATCAITLAANMNSTAEAQAAGRVSVSGQIRLLQQHENDHVAFLVNNLGASARPKPSFQNLTASNLSAFLMVARALENTGVGAYLGAAPFIFDRGILAAAGSIATIEARHAGFLNSLQSRAMTENVFGAQLSFERPLTVAEVVNLAGPFIANLNGGPPLSFSDTPSAANDIAILNFALALEYLEAEFYNINVPVYYP